MAEFCTNKLGLFPEKLQAVTEAGSGVIDTSYPISVELSLTDRCNFECDWCSDLMLRARQNGHMDERVVYSLLDDLAEGGTKGIVIEGGGEPTLHRSFADIIRRIDETGMAAGLITNGSILHYDEVFNVFEWVRVSLDVSTPAQMKELKSRKNGMFDQVIRNIERMARLKTHTTLGVSYIVTRKTREGIFELIGQLRDMGVDYVQIKPVVDHPDLALEDHQLDDLQSYQREGFQVFLDALHENIVMGNANLPCTAHSLSSIIGANGSVYLCGRLNTYADWPAIGNINQLSFREIWNSEERHRQARLVLDREFCRSKCPECRLTKFNVALSEEADFIPPKKVKTPNFI